MQRPPRSAFAGRKCLPATSSGRRVYSALSWTGSNKPPHVIEKIVEGKLNSYYKQVVLLDQPSIRDPKTTIGQFVNAAIAKLGENITISRFARFKIGEAPE